MQNYTPIDHLIPKPESVGSISGGAERQEFKIVPTAPESSVLHEVVEHKTEHEVSEYVEERPDVVNIDNDLQSMGAQSTGVSQFTTTQPIELPLSDEAVVSGLKAPYSSSLRWLSEFCLYILKHAHMHLKEIHGKIMRVPDSPTKQL